MVNTEVETYQFVLPEGPFQFPLRQSAENNLLDISTSSIRPASLSASELEMYDIMSAEVTEDGEKEAKHDPKSQPDSSKMGG